MARAFPDRAVAEVRDKTLEPAPVSRRHEPLPGPPQVQATGLPNELAEAGMHGNEAMTTANPLEQYELTPEGGRRIGWSAAAVALILAIAAAGWGWSAHRHAGTAEQALAAFAKAGETRVGELERQIQALDLLLQGANADVTRLRSELAARDAAEAAVAAETASAASAAPTAATETDAAGTPTDTLGATALPAAALIEPAAAPPQPTPETLAIVFDVNSSYLPASLDGGLRDLAARLEPGRGYEVELVGSVGNGDVEGKSAEEALRYNRWMAERRAGRVAEFLRKNAKSGELTIRQDFALNDPSRQVLVEVRPIAE